MTILGYPMESLYLITLVIVGLLTVLYIFFGDIAEGIADSVSFLNPALILAFITLFSASGYVMEFITSLSSITIIIISLVIAFILDTLLNLFVLIPLSSAEESLSYTEESLKGRVGKIIIPVPIDGFGEIVIESKIGMISRTAASYENEMIKEGQQVLVIEVQNGVLYVVPYENDLDQHHSG
ncbi:NfeD family protein [Oceanobacillus rekensis]|uniref:NfeD family protein n=1 Tax=Oceanobacillus rekensis TaxID=937927 RepID=UPI000B44DB06|nr:NfeD family protein [Oceanobacillus rekensis]